MAENTVTFKKGDLLIVQGEVPPCIYYLMDGSVEILSAPDEYAGLDKTIIVAHSVRVGVVAEKTFLAGVTGKTVRAMGNVSAQRFPVEGGFARFAQEDPARGVTLLMHLFRRLELSFADISKVHKLYQNLCIVGDNLSLMSSEVSAGEPPERIAQRMELLVDTFKKNAGVFPRVFDGNFLVADRSAHLKKKYNVPGESLEMLFDREQYTFYKRFLKIDKNIFAHVVKADPEIAIFMFSKVTENLVKVIDKITLIYDSIDEEMELIFGAQDSWCSFLAGYGALADWERSGRLSPDFAKNFAAVSVKIFSIYAELTGVDPAAKFTGLNAVKEYCMRAPAPKPGAASSAGPVQTAAGGNIERLYANSMQQIMEFGVVSNETATLMMKYLNEFKKMPNPFSPDDDARKLRRQITKVYWQIYAQVYIRSIKETQLPMPVKLMIQYGFLDEKLLEPGQVESLHNLVQQNEKCELPILFHYEFLQKIYAAEEPPSLNEVGLTYEKQLREEADKSAGKGGLDENDPLRKVEYEINNMLQSTVGVCSGSRTTAFPILNSYLIKGNPEQFLISKTKVAATIKDILCVDFSAFYRETVTKMNEPILLEEEVLPYFILLPAFGTKSMMWQELVGTNKRSRARIVLPVFFMGDLRRSIAHSIAAFRWEVNRSLQGAMWADPVEGGLTGAYYDYVQFFRKNSKLSSEAKDKLHERIKGVRNNMKELFCEDYITWVTYEKEGTMKLNSVVRDIFYRHIPFRRDIREKMETMPAFVELAGKFKNIRTRKVNEYMRKFKKYEDPAGNLPPNLKQYLDFLRM